MTSDPATARAPNDPPPSGLRSLWLLGACTILILAVLIAATAGVIVALRQAAMRETETTLRNFSVVLAEQADRALQAIDIVLSGTIEALPAEGVTDADSYRRVMADKRFHLQLRDKVSGLPYVNAITYIDVQGNLINFSRYWPIPKVNIADRDYFRAMQADPKLERFISRPVPNRGDGTWTIYLARRVRGADGHFIGLVLGAVELRYFEDLYRSVAISPHNTLALLRDDGVLLARYPQTPGHGIGEPLATNTGLLALRGGNAGVIHDISPFDQVMRIKAAKRLDNYPLVLVATETEATALRAWQNAAWVLGVVALFCCLAIVAGAVAIARWWRHQQSLGRERARRAETDRALAMAEADLMREREQAAERTSTAKSEFLASMSHEIRTPLNAVLGLAGLLLDSDLAAHQRKLVQTIHDSGESLLLILNDILDFSKLDAGRMQFEATSFSPATLTEGVGSILSPHAVAKGLTLHTRLDAALPPILVGDAGRIRQVLLNLVSNAVKFTEQGAIEVSAHAMAREGSQVTVEWIVRDTGIGIPADRLGALFAPFAQADSSITRRFGGSGLGLAICKHLVERMGGAIGVESRLGMGSTFRFHLPLPIGTEAPQAAERQESHTELVAHIARLGRRLRVLFAEDNPTNQFVAVQLLKDFQIQVDIAANGLEAVSAATRGKYDVICMDMSMPEMDGLAATRAIRALVGPAGAVPIIALTANAFPEDVRACLAAGMNDFLAKPVSKPALVGALLRAVGAGAPPADVPAPAPAAEDPACDQAALDALAADLGVEARGELVQLFLTETTARLRKIAEPPAAATPLVREVHALKGSAGTAGAMRLARLAKAMELRLRAGGSLGADDLAALQEAFDDYAAQVQAIIHQEAAAA